jgi:hypothetical protein
MQKMEKRLNTKLEEYITKFKDAVRNKVLELGIENKEHASEIINFVYDYDRLSFQKEDFVKRKRVKNSIPNQNRCSAKRANGERCTRRCKEESEFCGTHYKGTPHGLVQHDAEQNQPEMQKMDVFAKEVKGGIVYYIDTANNVYKTEDILEGKTNPRIVAKCIIVDGECTIPEFGLV